MLSHTGSTRSPPVVLVTILSVTIKPNEIIAMTRFKVPSVNLEMLNVLLVLNGSAMGRSRGCNRCAALAVLGLAAGGISGLLGSVFNGLFMVDEAG